MAKFLCKVWNEDDYFLKGQEIGQGVATLNNDGVVVKLAISFKRGSRWTYTSEYITTTDKGKNAISLTVSRDASQYFTQDENGEDIVKEYEARQDDIIISDLKKVSLD